MRNTILAALITLSFLNANAQTTSTLKKVEKSIVTIMTYDKFGFTHSTGTGFFIDKSGKVLTNVHVIDGARFGYITDYRDSVYEITKIKEKNTDHDILTFQLRPTDETFLPLSITEKIPEKGDEVFLIGNPFGFKNSLSKGMLSAVRNDYGIKRIQTTAAISSGSSGSPIMNRKGQAFGIISYSISSGQNLNFGYWLGDLSKMSKVDEDISLEAPQNQNLHIINRICDDETALILHSIEEIDTATLFHFTYSNLSIFNIDSSYIYANIDKPNEAFYLEDAISGEKHYIRSATIGNSVEAPTYLDYAETREFTLVFPPIGKMRKFHLKEGMQGLKWWFMDVDLTYKPNIKYTQLKAFSDSIGQEIRVHIADENYQEAMLQLKYQINKSPLNTILYNLAGITSFLQKKKDDAEQYFIKAFALDSTDINNLLDLYTLYLDKGNYLKALNFIDKAIDIAPNFPDLNLYKGDILDQLLQYKDAISYFEKYLKSDRSDKEYALLRIAVCKMKLGDKIACEDLIKYEKYYSYLKDSEVNAIKVFIKENCVK